MNRAEICPSLVRYISLQTPGLTSHWGSSRSPWARSSRISVWGWVGPSLWVLGGVTVAINGLSPMAPDVPFIPPVLSSAGAEDVVQVHSPTPKSTAGSYSTGPPPQQGRCPLSLHPTALVQKKGDFKLRSVKGEHSLSHVYPEQSAVAPASPWLCVWSFPMNTSVVSSSHELFSLWDGETAWENEVTLLVCTSLALHSHPLKLFALPFSVGIWGGPWSKLLGTGRDIHAGETGSIACLSLLTPLLFFLLTCLTDWKRPMSPPHAPLFLPSRTIVTAN